MSLYSRVAWKVLDGNAMKVKVNKKSKYKEVHKQFLQTSPDKKV